ncbi:tRNA pseudouridine(38-40) synthase TruA [Sulfurimonas sp. SAG-AH-194-C20]|nr:tRNA pseudouridine(38-40) synthase TruA [Sulfurimonas sp. SAG-AH-194-C20]MDF1879127.1 tRNA pseudouridine(38-40) synthase TruA [Sulfurimonas sp. SAG-AH-194-C20]
MRVKVTLVYNGTHYLGSQIQTQTTNTIMGQIQKVLTQLGIDSKIIASGRTDKAVHALGQVCHFDTPAFWDDTKKLKRVLNSMLPSSISIKHISKVSDDFHARYCAKVRTYRYIIKQGESNPFEADLVTFIKRVDIDSLRKNIELFVGEHDFSSFMKTGSDINSSVREVYKAFVYEHKGYIVLIFSANGFLRSQIRLMVGALLTLNAGEIQKKLDNNSSKSLKPAPANGLYLSKISY